jgi:hypothetical protein
MLAHKHHLFLVLQKLQGHQIFTKLSERAFEVFEMHYLEISSQQLAIL